MKRNGYIDIIKFFLAIIVAEFHVNSGLFPGGRMAVEGFFMINGYLMMCSLQKSPSHESTASSTGNFIWRKYKSLFYYLFPAAILSYIVICISKEWTLEHSLLRLPLLIFEIIPLYDTGMLGEYVVGVSWYLSAMFIALAILFPLCKKFQRGFSLIACPIIGVMGYGTLSHFFGHLAVNKQYIPETIFRSGLIRGIACCALGCFLYELSQMIKRKSPSLLGRFIFTGIELLGINYCLYIMHTHPKTLHEYVVAFVIFLLLFIGINGLSLMTYLWNPKWTKYFGTGSTLIILSHSCWVRFLTKELGQDFQKTSKIWLYILAVTVTCIVVYCCSILLKLLFANLKKVKVWKTEEKNNT